jgi:hypothetical protein
MAKKDFSKAREPISFEIDGESFEAAEAIPADVLAEGVTILNSIDPETATAKDQIGALKGFMEMCLFPESYERFVYRMGNKANPIDLDQVDQIGTWLVEQYGMRPTQPSSASTDGSPSLGSGTTSTESTPERVLISGASPSIGS